MRLLLGWAINAGVLLLLPYLIPAVHIDDFVTALMVALVLGLLNAIVRPLLVILTLPITLLTLGLFLFVINGLMFWLASRLFSGFHIDSFAWSIVAALVYSAVSWAVSAVVLRKNA
ncbi:MAG: phage holin family protein [Burkholderiales bacterium]|jgi:putative membrane protein|nr:phage holin family protein [Burkholderiales bacterium]